MSVEFAVARMAASDGIPLNTIVKSKDIQLGLKARHLTGKADTFYLVSGCIRKMAEIVRENILTLLREEKKKVLRFSLTIDEWTSVESARYFTITIHTTKQFYNLGMHRIIKSLDAKLLLESVKTFLRTYDIDLDEDIVGVTSDAAPVMARFGRFFKPIHQLCYAHAIQLAVVKVLYNYKEKIDEGDEHVNEEVVNLNSEEEEEDVAMEDHFGLNVIEENNQIGFKNSELGACIKKVREAVKIFKKSPLKNDTILQPYIRAQNNNKNLNLVLDCQTRWNSLADMIERFLYLENSVRKALVDVKSKIGFNDDETKFLDVVSKILQPIKCAVENLCTSSANLFTADSCLTYLLKNIDTGTQFGEEIKKQIILEVLKRRTKVSCVIQYLHSRNNNELQSDFVVLSKTQNHKFIIDLFHTLNFKLRDENVPDNNPSTPGVFSFKESLYTFTNEQCNNAMDKSITKSPEDVLKRELRLFDQTGQRGIYLTLIYKALLTITATSVESERSFSTAGRMKNKIRSKMGDDLLNNLTILNRYFKNI